MKRRFLILMLLLSIASVLRAQVPVQAPVGIKSQTAIVSQALTGQTAGNVNLVAVTFCEHSCAASISTDVLSVTDAAGDTCVQLATGTQANEAGYLFKCPITLATNTITATVTNFQTYVHVAIQVSEWSALPQVFAVAVVSGPTSTPGAGFTLANSYNGSSVTAYGSGTPTFTPPPAGGIVSFSFGPLQVPFVGSNGGSGFVATFPIASLSQIPACGPNDGACSLTLQITDGNGNVITSGSAGSVAIVKTFSGGTLTVPIVTIAPR